MHATTPTRATCFTLTAFGLLTALTVGMHAQRPRTVPPPAPRASQPARAANQAARGAANQPARGANGAPKGEHLNEWMNAHNNLTAAQQQQALENEPGFRNLPPQTQQRYRDRLSQLNAMDPSKREELLRRNEHIEQLSPEQRGQVRGAMQQLGALPPDQQHAVARSFNELRRLPADQRAAAMGRIPLNDAQRATLNNLMRVEPMLPPPAQRQ